jgi:hypothetical protein
MILVYLLGISALGFIGWKLKTLKDEMQRIEDKFDKDVIQTRKNEVNISDDIRDVRIKVYEYICQLERSDIVINERLDKLEKIKKEKPKKEKKNAK